MFKSEERITYETLKTWALEAHFDGCRDLGIKRGWQQSQVLAFVSHSFEDGFERPIEDLMWKTILLILSGGWQKEYETRVRSHIINKIQKHGLDNLLTDLSNVEAELFRHDLQILKLT